MTIRLNTTRSPLAGRPAAVLLALVLAMLTMSLSAHASEHEGARRIVGSWYLALDAGPFDPNLAGRFLSGLAQFHADRTFIITDAGDFGADSFLQTLATPQFGSWKFRSMGAGTSPAIEGTAIHLEAHKDTGEVLGWNKVNFSIGMVDSNRAEGVINVYFLPCSEMPPLPTPLTCPDPIENADSFVPAAPPDVPVVFTRIVAGQ